MNNLRLCVLALVALLRARDGGTARELGEARAAAQRALDLVVKDVGRLELPRY